MTYFTPAIDKYLAYWLLSDTWYTDQDIEDNFWGFVIAIHYYSKPLKNKKLTPDDPSLASLPERHRILIARKRTSRNPRTYNRTALTENILLAIERNYPSFDMGHADSLVTDLCEKAMIVLDALWFAKIRIKHFRHIRCRKTLHLK